MNDNSRIAKNTIFLSLRMVVVMIITIFTTRLLLEGLGVKDYGIYNVTIGIVSLCSFLQPAMANGIQRFFNFEIGKNDLERARNVFNTGIQIQLLISLVIIVICETIGLWYVMNKLVVEPDRHIATMIIYQISVVSLFLNMMQVPYLAAIMGHEKMDFFALISIVDAVLKLVIAYFLRFATTDHLVLYSILLLSVTLFDFSVYAYYSTKNFPEIRIHIRISRDLFRPMLSFSGWNLLEKFSRLGKDQGINLALNYYLGPVVNAARGVVGQVTYGFGSLVDSTVTASRPQSIQSYARGEYQRALHIMFSLSKFTLLLLYVLMFPVYLELPYILHLWLGNNIPAFTLPLLNIALITIVFDKLASPISVVVHATGKMRLFNIVSGVLNIVVVPISLYALKRGADAIYVYWVLFWMTLITHVALVITLRKLIVYSVALYFKDVILRSLLVVSLSCWFPWFSHHTLSDGFGRLIIVVLTSVFFSSIASYIIGLNKSEREICKYFIYKLLNNKV